MHLSKCVQYIPDLLYFQVGRIPPVNVSSVCLKMKCKLYFQEFIKFLSFVKYYFFTPNFMAFV